MKSSILAQLLFALCCLVLVHASGAGTSPTPTCSASCPAMDLGNNSPPASLFTQVDSPPNDILCFYFDGSACLYNKDNGDFDGQPGSTNCPSSAPLSCTYSRRGGEERRAALPVSSRGNGQQAVERAESVHVARFEKRQN